MNIKILDSALSMVKILKDIVKTCYLLLAINLLINKNFILAKHYYYDVKNCFAAVVANIDLNVTYYFCLSI